MLRMESSPVSSGDARLAGTQTFSGNKTFTGGLTSTSVTDPLRSSTFFGLGAGIGSARMPFYQNSIVSGPSFTNTAASGGADDYVGHQINVKFDGGFAHLIQSRTGEMTSGSTTLTLTSGTFADPIKVGYWVTVPGAATGGGTLKAVISSITSPTTATLSSAAGATVTGATVKASLAPDPTFLFGANDFFVTGNAAGDLSAIDNIYGRLTEVHVYTPGSNLTWVKGTQSEIGIEASATGTTINSLAAHYVRQVFNHPNATITNSYGIYVEGNPTPGATNSYAIYAGNGKVRFGGATRIVAQSSSEVPLTLQTGPSPTADALALYDITGTNRTFHLNPNGSVNSSSFVLAFEGLAGQVALGLQPNSRPGISFGTASDAYLYRESDGSVRSIGDFAAGKIHLRTSGVPTDASLAAGDLALYIDSTSGAMKLMIKAKDAGGTVRTGQVALA